MRRRVLNEGPALQEDMRAEVESLQLELETTVSLYNQACEELVHAQKKVSAQSLYWFRHNVLWSEVLESPWDFNGS